MRVKKIYKRILSMIVCAALMMGSFPTTVLAEKTEKVLIDLIELEEAAEPTEFPAKGLLHASIAIDTKQNSDGTISYVFDEMYFNVLVDQFQKVYASVGDLSAHLDYNYEYYDGTAIVSINNTSKVIFAMGDREACYTNYWISGCVDMKEYPIWYDETMYVPLDAFIQITGASGFYCGTNEKENEKQELYIIPPQRTIMDDLSEFCKNAYNRYAFTFEKDLKYTSDKTGKQAGMANVIEYLDGLLRLDWRSWIMVADGSDKTINLNDDKNVDAFMDEVLKLNAASLDQMFASATSDASLPDVLMDVLVEYHQENIDVEMDYVDIMTAEWYKDAMRGCDVDFVARMKEQSKVYNEWHARSQQIGLASKALDIIGFAGGTISAYLKTLNNLKNGCDISVQGAKLLYNRRNEIRNKTIKEDNVTRISNKINSFQGDVKKNAFDTFSKEYAWEFFKGSAKLVVDGVLSKAALILEVYALIADIVSDVAWGGGLQKADNYMSACFGIQYESEILQSAFSMIDQYVDESRAGEARRSVTEKEIRQIFYHTLAACYTTRNLGCTGAAKQLEKYPEIESVQKARNQQLAEMMGRAMDSSIPMGFDYCDLANMQLDESNHYPNVLFNILEIEGQILDIEDNKPAKGVKVEVSNEAGEKLTEFETDKNGMFDASIELDDVDTFSEEPQYQTLDLRMKYKKYEDIIETVNLQVFKKTQIDGLRVGEIKEDILAFLCSATREDDGETILGIRIIEMPEGMWQYDLQQFYSGLSMTYADFDQTTSVSDVVEKLILKEGVSFETIYSKMYGKNTYAGAMLDMIDQYTGIYSEHLGDSYEALRRSDLQEAADIQDFINAYVKEVGTYPTFQISKINSKAVEVEPVMVFR